MSTATGHRQVLVVTQLLWAFIINSCNLNFLNIYSVILERGGGSLGGPCKSNFPSIKAGSVNPRTGGF